MEARIILGVGGKYRVIAEDGMEYICWPRGIFRYQKQKPLIGDRVRIEQENAKTGEAVLCDLLPRTNTLIRPAFANADQALLVMAVASPDPGFYLMDRYLLNMDDQNLPVILCFHKTDKTHEPLVETMASVYEACGRTVLFTSIDQPDSIDRLKGLLSHKTTVFAGPSGVGKSSLINALMERDEQETGELSRKIERGKNTTRHTRLMRLDRDTWIADTPGFTSVRIPELEPGEVREHYPEFFPYEKDCRFLGCAHKGERDCGVKAALMRGEISPVRYENYIQLYTELEECRRNKMK